MRVDVDGLCLIEYKIVKDASKELAAIAEVVEWPTNGAQLAVSLVTYKDDMRLMQVTCKILGV